jgi:hypothetical protein
MMSARVAAAVLLVSCACATTQPKRTDEERVVDRVYAAYNARDLEAFMSVFAANVEIYRPPDRLWLSGADAVRQYYGPRFVADAKARGQSIARIVHGRYVVDHDRVTGSATGPDRTVVWIYEIANGRIVRAWVLP